jgi:NTP pyrophosphatase (non-canonical NTP hydrolase)
MSQKSVEALATRLRQFAAERDWEQFHSPKNISMALSVEVAEIVEHFQWMTEQQSRELSGDKKLEVSQELADAFIYLVRLADQLDVDLLDAADNKLQVNEAKYPADRVRGSSRKYTDYD